MTLSDLESRDARVIFFQCKSIRSELLMVLTAHCVVLQVTDAPVQVVCIHLVQVIDTLPSMMNALRMVWIISRHYNRDDRMVPLMEMRSEEHTSELQSR